MINDVLFRYLTRNVCIKERYFINLLKAIKGSIVLSKTIIA